MNLCICNDSFHCAGTLLHLGKGEFALEAKYIDVVPCISCCSYYGEAPLRKVYGGDSIIVNEDLAIWSFSKETVSLNYLDDTLRVMRSIELLDQGKQYPST